ncbi:hypothetical protein BCR43DRAFT_523260 [Syncephalastrum racemosum]|uniref:Uncharacterized protein n=1 Tax=Syncephalastrum racemosum TaxID=13706 RepID=A0A1X2HL23_SYNRA|nr:hypothetical protein BCR43DRAFT_523260 [Syncephalastrum racemosum]
MQISYVLGLFAAVFATAAFADTGAEGGNTNIDDTSGLLNNVLANGLLNDNSQHQDSDVVDKKDVRKNYYDYHHGDYHHGRHHGHHYDDDDRWD